MKLAAAVLLCFASVARAWSTPATALALRPAAKCSQSLLVARPAHIPLRASLAAMMVDGDKAPVRKLVVAYQVAGAASVVAWTVCSVVALKSHPNAAIDAACGLRHNVLTIAQALALPLPLLWSVFDALQAAASNGWDRLKSATYRRLNLGAAAASLWLAAAAVWAPAFATGHNMYPPALKAAAAAAHMFTAAICLGAWGRCVDSSPGPVSGHYVPRITRGFIGSLWRLAPSGASDDPDAAAGRDGRNEWALAALLFGYFSVLPVVSPFPLATVPAILGKRLSRAVSGFTFLSAVVAFTLKDAAERGRATASTFKTLRRGLGLGCASHLAVVALKLAGVDGGGYSTHTYIPTYIHPYLNPSIHTYIYTYIHT